LINDIVDLGHAQLGFSRLAQQHGLVVPGLAAHEWDRGAPPLCACPAAAGQSRQAGAGNGREEVLGQGGGAVADLRRKRYWELTVQSPPRW
jgi:hypothetical protein